MTPLAVQTYLREGGTLAALASERAIKVKRHDGHAGLVLLKYDQIASQMADPVVQDCRGLILDEHADWAFVALGFRKFFNMGEGHAAPIDWATARVQEKVDGSLVVAYFYNGEWQVATSGTPDASGPVGDSGETFAQLFWRVLGTAGAPMDVDLLYVFELSSPASRIVVRHEAPVLTLLACRDRRTGVECIRTTVEIEGREIGVRVVREFPLDSFDACVATFATMDPLKQEGYVVVDAQGHRVKVKHPGYVALHHMRGEGAFTRKRALEVIRAGEATELAAVFPGFAKELDAVQVAFDAYVEIHEAAWRRAADMPYADAADRKAFALHAQSLPGVDANVLYSLKRGKVATVREYLRTERIEALAPKVLP